MNEARAIERAVAVRVLDRVAVLVEAFVVVAIAFNIVMTFTNTMLRYITNQDFPWATDAWAILISIITFLGAPSYFRRTTGMAYTALIDQTDGAQEAVAAGVRTGDLPRRLPGGAHRATRRFSSGQRGQTLAVLGISTGFVGDLARHRPRAACDLHDREARGADARARS